MGDVEGSDWRLLSQIDGNKSKIGKHFSRLIGLMNAM